MRDFVIFTDSTSDLNRETREEYGIRYVAMNYSIDEVEYEASLDWESHSPKEYYDLMRSGKRVFTTQVPQTVYYDAFKSVVEQGKDIVYIACSSALSASVKTAKVVAKELMTEFPEAKICCVDSLISSLGQGFLVIEAAKKRAEGLSAADTAKYIESIRLCVNQCGTVESLEYLRRAGRIKASKAFFGNLFGVKPLVISDRTGQNYAYRKVKGITAARMAIAEDIKAAANGNYGTLYLSHADCEEEVLKLRDVILSIAPFENVVIDVIRPIVGASVGPGTVIAFCFGTEVMVEGNE